MNELDLARALDLPALTLAALEATPLPQDADNLRRLFWQAPAEFEQQARRMDEIAVLRLYLTLIPETRARYDALGIPESIFRDNLKDIGIWCRDNAAKLGRAGFKQWSWIGHSLRLELFRLGRLQFEPHTLTEALSVGDHVYPAGTPVLDVHIPAEDPLDPKAVRDSLSQARAFFPQYFRQQYDLMHCHSWLLSPQLKELLPPDSNILQFQRLFSLYAQLDERQAEERVFGQVLGDPALYPESTSLQRALKAWLCAGNNVQVGAGVIRL